MKVLKIPVKTHAALLAHVIGMTWPLCGSPCPGKACVTGKTPMLRGLALVAFQPGCLLSTSQASVSPAGLDTEQGGALPYP